MCASDVSRPLDGPSLDRRSFLVNASTTAGALVLGFSLPIVSRARAAAGDAELHAYVRIGADESVTITYGGSELGQGTMSGLAQIFAEELKVNWADVVIEQAELWGGGLNYLGKPVCYFTAGSSAVRGQHDQLRNAGAAAREMLITTGATRMGASPAQCWAENGVVYGPSLQSFTYGELADAAAMLPIPTDPSWTEPADYTTIGKTLPRKDIPLKVNGRAKYGIDVHLGPDMFYASVQHCPVFGGVMRRKPRKPAGAMAVVPLTAPESRGATTAGDINAVAVVTDSNTWKAMQAAKRLSVDWVIPAESADLDDEVMRLEAEDLMLNGAAIPAEDPVGDAEGALAHAKTGIDATYSLPYVSHVCMEVLNCTVDYRGDSCEIWCPVQAASWVVSEAAKLSGLAPGQITVHTTFLGGGLGRKIERDYYSQAIQVGMALGRPVKLTWTREEDTRFDQYRPMALINVQAGIDDNGAVAWKYRHVSPSILKQRGWLWGGSDSQATEGQTHLPYGFDHSLSEWVEHPAKVPVGFWRSVGHSLNAFAVESAIDELAYATVRDPIDLRKELMAGYPRALAVVEAADAASS